jgi:hypothetical protein
MEAVRQGTLHRRPNALHRNVALIWNTIAQKTSVTLQPLSVPSFRAPIRRIDWSLLPESFCNELDRYRDWCSGEDPFAVNVRARPLALQTVNLQRNHIRAAVTALVESGISPDTATSLRDLVTINNFKRILRRRHELVGGRENVFNRDLARTLMEIARRWVKVDAPVLDELKRLASWGATSSLELAATEVKNQVEAGFDIPDNLAKMLIEYRNRLVPKVIGRRPDRLFIKADGSPKNQWSVAWLIRTVLRRRLGLQFSGHAFRHLSAKTILDQEPGNFETVRQLLGHKSLRTTVSAYAGTSTRRAARHHQNLLEQALSLRKPVRGRRTSRRRNKRGTNETQG